MHTIGHTLAAICINVVLITVFTHTHVTMSFTSPSSHIHVTFSFSTLHHSLSLSVLTAIFQVYPGQPVFTEAKDDGGGGDNWTTGAISRAKLQSNHHNQQTNIQFLQAGCPSCHPTNSVKALKGNHCSPL